MAQEFEEGTIDMINAALAAQRAGQIDSDSVVTMSTRRFIRLMTTAQQNHYDLLQYQAYHATEKSMRQFAEEDLGKFRKLIGRLYWWKGQRHG